MAEHAHVCANCEAFDRFYGDCLNPFAPRFQTKPEDTCRAFVLSSTIEDDDKEVA